MVLSSLNQALIGAFPKMPEPLSRLFVPSNARTRTKQKPNSHLPSSQYRVMLNKSTKGGQMISDPTLRTTTTLHHRAVSPPAPCTGMQSPPTRPCTRVHS